MTGLARRRAWRWAVIAWAVAVVVGGLLTLWLRCWTRADIEQLQGLHRRFAAGRPLLLGRLLDWSGARAGQQP